MSFSIRAPRTRISTGCKVSTLVTITETGFRSLSGKGDFMKLLWITLAAATAFAQNKSLTCENENHRNDQITSCEGREQTIAYGGRLTVDGGVNGGVSIKGWDNASVLVRSKVEAYGPDDASAKATAAQVR